MKTFIRLIDSAWVTELDIDPLCAEPNPNFQPNQKDYATVVPSEPIFNKIIQTAKEVSPINVGGVWTQQWEVEDIYTTIEQTQFVITQSIATEFAAYKTKLSTMIDSAVMNIYSRPANLSEEYKLREAAALAYEAAGYTGVVPARITSFAVSAGLSVTEATNRVLTQAALYRDALEKLGDLRMKKYAIQRATTEVEANAIMAATMEAIVTIAEKLA